MKGLHRQTCSAWSYLNSRIDKEGYRSPIYRVWNEKPVEQESEQKMEDSNLNLDIVRPLSEFRLSVFVEGDIDISQEEYYEQEITKEQSSEKLTFDSRSNLLSLSEEDSKTSVEALSSATESQLTLQEKDKNKSLDGLFLSGVSSFNIRFWRSMYCANEGNHCYFMSMLNEGIENKWKELSEIEKV